MMPILGTILLKIFGAQMDANERNKGIGGYIFFMGSCQRDFEEGVRGQFLIEGLERDPPCCS